MSEQRRSEERIQLSYYLKAYERGSQKLVGQVLDITRNGINLLCVQPVEVGTTKAILVDLPEPISGKTRLPLNVECRWSKVDINPSYYSVGFRFVENSANTDDLIESLMDSYFFGVVLEDAF